MAGIDFLGLLITFVIVIISLTVHEAAHAWSALRLGDGTAKALGRVSLNPAVHVDLIGTIVFPLIAMVTRVPVLGWAKPVPVDFRQLGHHWKRKFMVIAAAGPASNLVLASLAAIMFHTLTDGDRSLSGRVLAYVAQINVQLAVFNMIPIPPLDGGNVLAGLLHGRAADAFDSLRPYGFVILYALMFGGILDRFVFPIAKSIESVLL